MTVRRIQSRRHPRSTLAVLLCFIILVCHKTASKPSRLVIRSAKENDGFIFPGKKNYWRTNEDNGKTAKRGTFGQRSRENVKDDIVFPTDDSEQSSTTIFTPRLAPECRSKTYCETTDFYPQNYVNNVIKMNDELKFLAVVDVVEDIAQRIVSDDSTALCPSNERLIYPTAAQNRENNWLFVLNQENFRQGVRIEVCLSTESECSVIGGFAYGYRSMCKQKHILRQMVAISPNGTKIIDMFRLPSSCCCHVTIDSPFNRMGINLDSNRQTSVLGKERSKNTS